MNIRFPLQIGLGFALGLFGLVSGELPAQAQTGNQSDVTGTIITTSDVAGGAFAPGGGGRRVLVFRTPQIQDAVFNAARTLNQQLAARNLPVVATGSPTAIPATVQRNIDCMLNLTADAGDCTTQVENALITGGANPTLVRNLVSSLQGLTKKNTVTPAQFRAVTEAYNALINASSEQFLSNPPEELRAIQSVLSVLLSAAYATN